MTERLGIFGCTADPLTLAHREIVKLALSSGIVDRMLVVPTTVSWHRAGKTSWLSDSERVYVASALLEDLAGVEVSDAEIRRKLAAEKSPAALARLEQRGFCDQMLDIAANALGKDVELYPVVGQDSYAYMRAWESWEAIAELASGFVVAKRAGCGDFAEDPRLPVVGVLEFQDGWLSETSATAMRAKWSSLGVEAYVRQARREIAAESKPA